jgi:hypothetical protein
VFDGMANAQNDCRSGILRLEWQMPHFNTLRNVNYLQSETFRCSGFDWFLGLYANGDNADSTGYISLYLFLDTSTAPKNKSITLTYSLTIANHKNCALSFKKGTPPNRTEHRHKHKHKQRHGTCMQSVVSQSRC